MELVEVAIAKRFPVAHGLVFPNGAFLHGLVEPVADFQAEKRQDGSRPQQRDKESGLPMWQCTVIDADADAGRREIGVSVKFAAEVQPVPPKNTSPLPWTPVEFVGLTALPYVDDAGSRPRIAWSFRAQGFVTPGQAGKPSDSKDAA
ncbi:plasmid replication, integration and excision activator [Oerskovia turbata]|uniref:Plasmid replication, integration and excision activator n=1 Tax=Oerskovia turbata TaxID=1713 RepID=A0A4Q1KK20_9CELL|nr:plasmid replication, integration and excision activator [Oerskovia turbata]RXR30201.1 plasmid replication, integration and excision activator [Oerskovia turbata]TGJ96230.1 plasmid replication, integration and excision activator [Actinotalea fermentans ATCC 43279 = JCM 9966 = DSM 3133]